MPDANEITGPRHTDSAIYHALEHAMANEEYFFLMPPAGLRPGVVAGGWRSGAAPSLSVSEQVNDIVGGSRLGAFDHDAPSICLTRPLSGQQCKQMAKIIHINMGKKTRQCAAKSNRAVRQRQ